ncbi:MULTISPECIES: hypothetical protein [Actinomadura]|uniref:Uncharacterized protein n=1 Tax=Actinomadura yumaensis TaxID=111807 RepID=A0ABW2CFP7_9ACTN|nr:hypothetical protein [Actinomadura sp. J1-007]MWK35823.1 hypothetical protein [Actinomadura sp. J1-007]
MPDETTTPSGLPVRVPQANLTPPLQTAPEPAAAPAGAPDAPRAAADPSGAPVRSPEEIQRIMDAYQLGTRRGRSAAAAQSLAERAAEGEDDQ